MKPTGLENALRRPFATLFQKPRSEEIRPYSGEGGPFSDARFALKIVERQPCTIDSSDAFATDATNAKRALRICGEIESSGWFDRGTQARARDAAKHLEAWAQGDTMPRVSDAEFSELFHGAKGLDNLAAELQTVTGAAAGNPSARAGAFARALDQLPLEDTIAVVKKLQHEEQGPGGEDSRELAAALIGQALDRAEDPVAAFTAFHGALESSYFEEIIPSCSIGNSWKELLAARDRLLDDRGLSLPPDQADALVILTRGPYGPGLAT